MYYDPFDCENCIDELISDYERWFYMMDWEEDEYEHD